ncbi:MAG: citrate synthase [Ignavibacteria bacterium]|nr:citrate synthase [Ignavibacteria bacterium]
METAKLILRGKEYDLPVLEGTEHEVGIDVTALRAKSGAITFDPGYGNTGSCTSTVTFIDGEAGILRYRGYPIEQLAEHSSFVEVCYLLLYGDLPTENQLANFKGELAHHSLIHEDMKKMFEGYPPTAHPMGILGAMVNSLAAFYGDVPYNQDVQLNMIRLLAKMKTIAAFAFKRSKGQPYVYPKNELSFTGDLINMMFSLPTEHYHISPIIEDALDKIFILHADHEQNCSTSTVRMVGSSHANLFATISAGIAALWGPLHGGANQEVITMLEHIKADDCNYRKYIELAKDKNSDFKLMGFGHRVYRNFDPRAKILKEAADRVLNTIGIQDPLLEIAKNLERVALEDPYFVERKLYPNVDFYSGIIYKAMGIPTNMFTVMFALGRLPGWIAQWKEMTADPTLRIYRPRQIYTGEVLRDYTPISERN